MRRLSRRGLLKSAGPLAAAAVSSANTETVEQWTVYEASFQGPVSGNPFVEVHIAGEFRLQNRIVPVEGFYDGAGMYRLRFMPDALGEWSFTTRSNSRELDGRQGAFVCSRASGINHGPVQVRPPHHLCYADGAPHVSVGTTCYAWAHQAEELEQETLKSLRGAPFNKVRMCILPTEKDPKRFPFERDASGKNDLTRFDVKFFQHFDQRIKDLRELGIEADLILFHPYDHLGYGNMPPDVNERYLRYVVARFAAFRNVWWSIANEFDLVKTKHQPEWDNFFRIVAHADPYAHLRSIHYSKVFYDYSKPWVTHLSLQSDAFEKTAEWLGEYNKPILFDECKYEGDIDRRWGNLSGHEMMRRFWIGMVSGAYVGHGETYHDNAGVAWTSKGGSLSGESPKRIAFLRNVFEEAASLQLNPPPDPYYPCLAKPNTYYLYYFDYHQPAAYEFHLPDTEAYRAEVIDPWGMTIKAVDGTYKGKFSVKLPGKPYMAVRFRRAL
ncbi:MAG: DUF5605 domain-containing protein [Acidobacteriaceae bacterium]|nr:DUF5605 domain-containing protein [Acidobacteriaceae bacterium]